MNPFLSLSNFNRSALIAGILVYWCIALILFKLSDAPLDHDDGIFHFQIAHFSWEHPDYMLDHWGKPLFNILSSPFAQLGFIGMVIFNLLLFSATAWAIYKLANGIKLPAAGLAPFILMSSTVYFQMVVAGMTEILFAALVVFALLMYQRGRSIWAAIIISLSIVARPESVLIIPLFGLLLLFGRHYKSIPFLALGFIAFSLAGFLFDDRELLWLIGDDPYPAVSPYGSGSIWHYLKKGDLVFGLFCLIFLPIGGLMLFLRRQKESILWFSLIAIIAVLGLHSFLWWQGLKGSLGLVRVMATITPLVVLVSLFGLSAIKKWGERSWVLLFGLGLLLLADIHAISKSGLPKEENSNMQVQAQAAAYFKTLPWEGRVSYIAPYFAFRAGINPKDRSKVWLLWGLNAEDPTESLSNGDIIVWDSQFGPREGKIPESAILENTNLILHESYRDPGSEYRIHIAEVQKPTQNPK